MAFPGYPLDTNRTNSTPMSDRHPLDHEEERAALNDLQAQIDGGVLDITALQADVVALSGRLDALEADSGITNIALHSSFSASFFYRKIGRTVWFVCNIVYNGAGVVDTTVDLGIIPDVARPPASMGVTFITSAELPHRGSIDVAGIVKVNSLTISTGQALSLTATWLK